MNLRAKRTTYVALLAVAATVLVVFAMPRANAQQTPALTSSATLGVLDHFQCYDARGADVAATVLLKDQFVSDQPWRDHVASAGLFCNTARKIHKGGGAGIGDVDNHLTWYRIDPGQPFVERKVEVRNQFAPNGEKLTVVRPEYLAVPTQKLVVDDKRTGHDFPQDLDHFRCYSVKGDNIGPASVRLWDQFGPNPPGDPASWNASRVRVPRYLCNPASKIHFDAAGQQVGASDVQHPDAHLVCYELEPHRLAEHALVIRNQFGSQQRLKTIETEVLCVPSAKRELPPPTVTTLDHFQCYDAKGENPGGVVLLKDQFVKDQAWRDYVSSATFFCNATRKVHEGGGAGISDIDNHLTWYRVDPVGSFEGRTVEVRNQFVPDGQKLRVVQPEYLAVPTQKLVMDGRETGHGFPKDLDHFRCYSVKAEDIEPASVRLWDQFGPNPPGNPAQWDAFRVRVPRYLCNPTAKQHFDAAGSFVGQSVIQHAEDHLVCYTLEPDRPAEHSLVLRNQFGSQQKLSTYETELLCVPSAKREL